MLMSSPLPLSIIGSLAGTSYWGPVAGHGFITHDLDMLREERRNSMKGQSGLIPGNMEATPAAEDEEHYTRIHKRQVEEADNKEEQK